MLIAMIQYVFVSVLYDITYATNAVKGIKAQEDSNFWHNSNDFIF